MGRSKETVDKIFAGNLDGLPPLSSKVWHISESLKHLKMIILGCSDLHEFHLHGHVDGEELPDGVCVPQDQGVLQGEAWA